MADISTIEIKLKNGEYITKSKQHEKRRIRKNATGILFCSV